MACKNERIANGEGFAAEEDPVSLEDDIRNRPYQDELAERALQENVICSLGTGMGKTQIAVTVFKGMEYQIERSWDEGGKRTVVLVPSVALVDQQATYFARWTSASVKGCHGGSGAEWNKSQWLEQLRQHQMFVMVPAVFSYAIRSGMLDLARVNLLIVDECHNAVGKHWYVDIMDYIKNRPAEERPRILGLSASAINCEVDSADEMIRRIRELEYCYDAKVCTSVDESIGTFEAKPRVSVVSYQVHVLTEGEDECHHQLDDIINWLARAKAFAAKLDRRAWEERNRLNIVENKPQLGAVKSMGLLKKAFEQTRKLLLTLGPWCAYQAAAMLKKDLKLLMKHKYYDKALVDVSLAAVTDVDVFGSLLEHRCGVHKVVRGDAEGLSAVATKKVRKLIDIFRDIRGNCAGKQEEIRCIIFVTTRFEAWALHQFLDFLHAPETEFAYLKSGYIVGQATSAGNEQENADKLDVSYRQSKETLAKFRSGEINVLVATSVVEEGLDVPNCNVVIRFDPPQRYCSFVQSRGRARALDSRYFVLADEASYAETETKLKYYEVCDDVLKKACTDRLRQEKLPVQPSQRPCETFSAANSNAVVSMGAAMPFLQRYCASVVPRARNGWNMVFGEFLDTHPGQFVYRLYLSLHSHLKRPVTGPPMPRRKSAKQAAAVEAIRQLYVVGALDDNFLPVAETAEDDIREMVGDREPEIVPDGTPPAGSKRRRQYYPKPEVALLHDSRPRPNSPVYLYQVIIQTVRTFAADPSARYMTEDSVAIGLLSNCNFPSIPAFSTFVCRAEYRVSLHLLKTVELAEPEMDDVQKFHCIVWEQLLKFSECIALPFTPELDAETVYTVPLKKNGTDLVIDWEIMLKTMDLSQYTVITQPDQNRRMMKIKGEQYRDAVVVRWYKAGDDRFVVTNVRADLNPKSELKLDDYSCFLEYFERKYGIEIQDTKQPILEARFCSNQGNLLRRRYRKPSTTTDTAKPSKAERKRGGSLMLVPEMCQIFPVVAPLYMKYLLLPSVIHRLQNFCHMICLYERIKQETGIGSEIVAPKTWDPLVHAEKTGKLSDKHFGEDDDEQELSQNVVSLPNGRAAPDLEAEMERGGGDNKPARSGNDDLDSPDDYGLVFASFHQSRYYSLAGLPSSAPNGSMPMETDESASRQQGNLSSENQHQVVQPGCALDLADPPFFVDAEFDADVRNVPLPDLSRLLYAFTTCKAAEGFNLERLEVIGDSFLKLNSRLYVFFRFRNHQEGRLTLLCNKHESNLHLYRLAREKDLHLYIQNQEFLPAETMVPPGYTFDEKESDDILANSGTKAEKFPSPRIHQAIEDKSIADCMEALIGAFLVYSSARSAQVFMSWLGLRVLPLLPVGSGFKMTADVCGRFTKEDIPNPILPEAVNPERPLRVLTAGFDAFQARIGYRFHNIGFLLQAFTHATFVPNNITDCYQRLEFLGDAVLDFLITRYVYDDARNLGQGTMSDVRSALVNNRTFSELAVKYNFHNHVKFHSSHLHGMIDEFVDEIRGKDESVMPLEEMLVVDFDDDKADNDDDMTAEAEAPKALGDVFEAVAGAIYLDSGLSLDVVWRVYYNMMRPLIESYIEHCPKNYVRQLYEKEGQLCRFGTVERLPNGKCVMQVTILGKGTFNGKGNNRKAAKCNAARAALSVLHKSS